MGRAVAAVLLMTVAVASAATISIHGKGSSSLDAGVAADADQVLLTPSKTECEKDEVITVGYQRVANERDEKEKNDFVGLFRASDPTVLVPYDVTLLTESSQTGEVSIRCRRSGDMEVRMVRMQEVLGKAAVRVHGVCYPLDCNGHGQCVKGVCECQPGWDGEGCGNIKGEGAAVGWEGNPEGDFRIGGVITARAYHSAGEIESSGLDTIAIFSDKAPDHIVMSGLIPAGKSEVLLPLPIQEGDYFLKLVRGSDGAVIATSDKFGVYPECPDDCSFHGQCVKGKCQCESGFDRDDCSRGPGIVTVSFTDEPYATTLLNVTFSRDETAPALTDRDWIGVYKAGDEVTDNPIFFVYAISEKVYDPDAKAKLKSNRTHGNVMLMMPYETGRYVIRYVRQDWAKYFTTPPFEVYAPCPSNCSGRGECSQGQCVCQSQWSGDECEKGVADFSLLVTTPTDELYCDKEINVDFRRPAGDNTDFDFIGVYDVESKNNTDLLYTYAYAVANPVDDVDNAPSRNGTVTLQLSADGHFTVRYVNAYTLETEVELGSPITVYHPCANDCNGHGNCVRGECQCTAQWKGSDCSLGAGEIKLEPVDGTPVIEADGIGFKVHVTRPANHYKSGDFVALFPESGPFDYQSAKAFTYAKKADDDEVFLLLNSQVPRDNSIRYVLKYLSASHKDLGTSSSFTFNFKNADE